MNKRYKHTYEQVKRNPRQFRHCNPEERRVYEIAMAAVSNLGTALEHASEDLKDSFEIVLAAVQNDGKALRYASSHLKQDRNIVLQAVKSDGQAIVFAHNQYTGDYEVMKIAIERDPSVLRYATMDIRNDPTIVGPCLKRDGNLLEFAGNSIRNDRHLVELAIRNRGHALHFASNQLKGNRELVLLAIEENGMHLRLASNQMQEDPELATLAMQNGLRWRELSIKLYDNHDFALMQIANTGSNLIRFSERVRTNPNLSILAMRNNISSYHSSLVEEEYQAVLAVFCMIYDSSIISPSSFSFNDASLTLIHNSTKGLEVRQNRRINQRGIRIDIDMNQGVFDWSENRAQNLLEEFLYSEDYLTKIKVAREYSYHFELYSVQNQFLQELDKENEFQTALLELLVFINTPGARDFLSNIRSISDLNQRHLEFAKKCLEYSFYLELILDRMQRPGYKLRSFATQHYLELKQELLDSFDQPDLNFTQSILYHFNEVCKQTLED